MFPRGREAIMIIRLAIVAAALVAAVDPAFAQSETCMRRGGVDQNATAKWREMQRRADPQFMTAMEGVWYSETSSPQTGQVSHLYLTYQSNGILDYQNRVCSSAGYCSDYAGHGLFAGFFLGGGDFTMMSIISDLNRDRECAGNTGRLVDDQTIEDSSGGVMRKVR